MYPKLHIDDAGEANRVSTGSLPDLEQVRAFVADAHATFSADRAGVVADYTNLRNRGIAKLLEGYGRMYFDALEYTNVCTKQCSPKVNAQDLAVMGATLAGAEATR